MSAVLYTSFDSPIGELLLTGNDHVLRGLHMTEGLRPVRIAPAWQRSEEAFAPVCAQLREYFDGERTRFDVALDMAGTQFQRRVWTELETIPYGETISYGELACRVGQPSGARAVGLANGRNPVAVIVPCHRVIGADGALTGYGGGMERKRILLGLEAGEARLPGL